MTNATRTSLPPTNLPHPLLGTLCILFERRTSRCTIRQSVQEVIILITPTGFFAYASLPHSIPATIKAAIEDINKTQAAKIDSWEDLGIGGKYIIREICNAIDDCDFFCADITTINANVMFELGFAIARDKRVWLIRDEAM